MFVDTYKNGNAAPVMWNIGLLFIKTNKDINEGDEGYLCCGETYDYFHVYNCVVYMRFYVH